MGEFKSRVYTDRPEYADFEPAAKFETIKAIIAKGLYQHPNAICSYSGGSDSDIMIDLIETVRTKMFNFPPVKYCFFDTGLEMEATKRHVKEVAEKYGVEITTHRPKKNIVIATKQYSAMSRQGIPDYLVTMRKPGINPEPVTHTNESFPVGIWQKYASPIWTDINPSDTLQGHSVREEKDERHIRRTFAQLQE